VEAVGTSVVRSKVAGVNADAARTAVVRHGPGQGRGDNGWPEGSRVRVVCP
jgi:hypothetical protein